MEGVTVGPFGFDGRSRTGQNDLRTGEALREIGGRDTHQAYGGGWANPSNTPFRLYKHFTRRWRVFTADCTLAERPTATAVGYVHPLI